MKLSYIVAEGEAPRFGYGLVRVRWDYLGSEWAIMPLNWLIRGVYWLMRSSHRPMTPLELGNMASVRELRDNARAAGYAKGLEAGRKEGEDDALKNLKLLAEYGIVTVSAIKKARATSSPQKRTRKGKGTDVKTD